MLDLKHLLSYIEVNTGVLKLTSLRNCKLIIDAKSFAIDYYSACDLNNQYGGDYIAYHRKCLDFFSHLVEANITPYFVYDADVVVDGSALEHTLEEMTKTAADADNIANSIFTDRLKPILVLNVLGSVIQQLGFSVITCYSNSERNIIGLANELDCYVLSLNVKYLVCELNTGLLLINKKLQMERKNANLAVLKAELFKIDYLRSWKRIAHRNMFVVVYAVFEIFRKFESDLDAFFQKQSSVIMQEMSNYKTQNSEHVHQRIDMIMFWLAGKTTIQEAIDDLTENIGHRRAEIVSTAERCINEVKPLTEICLDANSFQQVTPDVGATLPDSILQKASGDMLYAHLVKVAVTGVSILKPQIEIFSMRSSYSCSAVLRKIAYSCLMGERASVIEYQRVGDKIQSSRVACVSSMANGRPIPTAQVADEMSVEERRKFVLECLVPNAEVLSTFCPSMQLLIALTSFWKRINDLKSAHVHALLLGFLAYHDDYLDQDKHEKQSKTARGHLISSIQQQIRSSHLKYFNANFVYTLCEFQSCLHDANLINLIMQKPFPSTLPSSFSGSLTSQIFSCLMDYGEESLAINTLLYQHEDLKKRHHEVHAAVMQFK